MGSGPRHFGKWERHGFAILDPKHVERQSQIRGAAGKQRKLACASKGGSEAERRHWSCRCQCIADRLYRGDRGYIGLAIENSVVWVHNLRK